LNVMAITRYTRWNGSILDSLNIEELMDQLSDFFLQSGYAANPWDDDDAPRQSLRETIVRKLVEMGHIPQEMMENWQANPESEEAKQLDEIVNQIIRRLIDEGWLRAERGAEPAGGEGVGEGYEEDPSSARFELTGKSVDFLGFRQLRHLLGSLGRSSLGRHETAHFSTGVEAYQTSKEYEFGDTINLDISATLMRAVAREGRIQRPDGAAIRVRQFLRHRADARHEPQHDPLRRGPLHPGETRRARAVSSDPDAVSGRLAAARALP
jgi:Ca-activated chloride channel family protein